MMKKIVQLIFGGFIALAMSACGGGSGSAGSSASTCAGGSSASSGSANVTALSVYDIQVGSGATLVSGNTATMNVTGYLYNSANPPYNEGTIFQPTYSQSKVAIGVGNFIPGFDQGLLLAPAMKVGGSRIITIPASLAYGACAPPASNIPPNSAVVFVVTLNSIP
jgi:FKBP-type peptidyl-prolyl cis-trans isomerase